MQEESDVQAEQEKVTRVWTTGDPNTDWARFEGQFALLDGAIRQWLLGLLVFDGLLFIALVIRAMEKLVPSTGLSGASQVVLPLVGVLISLVVFTFLFKQLCHRRMLERAWDHLAPELALTPYGVPAREVGTIALAPPAALALCSMLGWSVILIAFFVWHYASKNGVQAHEINHTFIVGTTVICGIGLFVTATLILVLIGDETDPDSR